MLALERAGRARVARTRENANEYTLIRDLAGSSVRSRRVSSWALNGRIAGAFGDPSSSLQREVQSRDIGLLEVANCFGPAERDLIQNRKLRPRLAGCREREAKILLDETERDFDFRCAICNDPLELVKVECQGLPIRADRLHADVNASCTTTLQPCRKLLKALRRVWKDSFRFAAIAEKKRMKRLVREIDSLVRCHVLQPPVTASLGDRPCAFELIADTVLTVPFDLRRRHGQAAYLSRRLKSQGVQSA